MRFHLHYTVASEWHISLKTAGGVQHLSRVVYVDDSLSVLTYM